MAKQSHLKLRISRDDMADAVFEMASREIEIVEAMARGDMAGPDPRERRHIEWRARALIEAHQELRKPAGGK